MAAGTIHIDCQQDLRPRALVQAVLPAVLGTVLMVRGRTLTGLALIIVGVALLLTGLISPRLFARWEQLVRCVARGVGIVVTWLILAPFFYLVFLPGRVILWLGRRDPMQRACCARMPTYWTNRPAPRQDHYTRLF